MKDTLVGFKVAKLAKEKGFKGIVFFSDGKGNTTGKIHLAPTQSLLQRWLREVHNISLFIDCIGVGKNVYYYGIYCINNGEEDYVEQEGQFTYEEALEKGLYQALSLLTLKK